jgi:predicted nuclease of restriction endonuclease-like RecB superfamily
MNVSRNRAALDSKRVNVKTKEEEPTMLLPFDCLAYKIVEGRLLPSWLTAADEPFVLAVLDSVAGLAGLQVGEADMAAPGQLMKLARDAKMPLRLAEALWAIERKRWEARIEAPTDPETLRDVLFELAARSPREEAIVEAAKRLGIEKELVIGSLFADRHSRRVLVAPLEPPPAADLIARYNLALAQTLLSRTMEVEVTVTGDPNAVVAAAKRDGLLARFEVDGESNTTRLNLTGPLSIFHDTAKYGRSIARFVPALVASPIWSLRARVTLGPRSALFELDHTGAVSAAKSLPAAPDGRLARKVARTLRGVGVRVDLHPAIERSGSSLVVPDFALDWAGGRVLVDVVPFATPEYLACKRAAILLLGRPMLVCVDQRFVGAMSEPWLLPYSREIDAWALFAAARRALDDVTSSASSSLSSSSSSSSSSESSSDLGGSP